MPASLLERLGGVARIELDMFASEICKFMGLWEYHQTGALMKQIEEQLEAFKAGTAATLVLPAIWDDLHTWASRLCDILGVLHLETYGNLREPEPTRACG